MGTCAVAVRPFCDDPDPGPYDCAKSLTDCESHNTAQLLLAALVMTAWPLSMIHCYGMHPLLRVASLA